MLEISLTSSLKLHTSTDDDPVDIDASTTRPVILNYVRPISVGLVLFGETDQFF